MMMCSRKKLVLLAVAGVALIAGGLVAFLLPSSHDTVSSSGSHTVFIALVPIYMSLIAVLAARRRKDTNSDG